MSTALINLSLRPGHPDFLDLPWERPMEDWEGCCERVVEVPRGLHRHPVAFVNYKGAVYALKELTPGLARKEYDSLIKMEEMRLPAVVPAGHAQANTTLGETSVLITRYLERSLPYRSLFMRRSLNRYRDHLLDAMAGLLVQLHLAGIYWGDCSLSNTLFRRDAGALQAYFVDAETVEIHPKLSKPLRLGDLDIMEENVTGGLADLDAIGSLPPDFPIFETGDAIRQRYLSLWKEITQAEYITPDERYRIHERIRALNELGFSVGRVSLKAAEDGHQLRMRVFVTDRSFHREQFHSLTGVEAEEGQARQIMNEIQQIKATLSQQRNRSAPLSVAAYYWLTQYYEPMKEKLSSHIQQGSDPVELYVQVLEHKWYLSEQAQTDVGHQAALDDFIKRFAESK